MRKIIAVALLSAYASVGIAQEKYTLKGEVKGNTEQWMFLQYFESNGTRVQDSVAIKNGKFAFQGKLKEPVQATLTNNANLVSFDDPNLLTLFIEPGKMEVQMTNGAFRDAQVKGSRSNVEFVALNQQKKPVLDAIKPLQKQYVAKSKAYADAEDELKALEAKVKKMHEDLNDFRGEFTPLYNQLDEIQQAFIKANPDSYISASTMQHSTNGKPLAEVEATYQGLSDRVKASSYGQAIAKEIAALKGGSPGSQAFVFSGTDIDGKPLSLADYKGKYVLVDFWASWCVPCRKGNPHLIALHKQYKDKGFEVIGVSDDDRNPEAWRKAVEQDGIQIWKHILRGLEFKDGQYDKSNDISEHYAVHTLPTKILIGPDGVIVGRYASGADSDTELDEKLKSIFGF